MRRTSIFWLTLLLASPWAVACSSMQNAAAKDPRICERDPKCASHDKSKDCWLQCSDDPACVDRCRELELSTGAIDR
jgi:hypothetical protein